MKKILSLLVTTTLVTSITRTIIACSIEPDSIANDNLSALIDKNFELESKSIKVDVVKAGFIKILNWDFPKEEAELSIFTVDETFSTETLDLVSEQIIVKSNYVVTENIILVIESASEVKPKEICKINVAVFELAQSNLVVNLALGNRVNGLVDPTIAVGVDGFTITDKSVISGFNTMDNVNFLSDDFEVVSDGDGTFADNDIIAVSYISSVKEGSEIVKSGVLLTFNSNIDPLQYFANKNLGEIRVFSSVYNRVDEFLVLKEDINWATIIFEQEGDKNFYLKYFKLNFIQNKGAAGQAIMENAVKNSATFQITGMSTLRWFFKDDFDVQFMYKFVKENRTTLSEDLPESGKIKEDVANLDDKSKNGQKDAKTEIYNQMNDDFKNQVNLSNFINFTNIIFGNKKFISNSIIPGAPNN